MRRILLLLLLPLLTVSPPDQEEGQPLPILMYHEIRETGTGKDVITPAELEQDLRWLRDAGYHAVTMEQVLAYVYEERPLPEKSIVLSFDDGCLSYQQNAVPLLEQYGMCAVLSVIGKSTDDFSTYPSGNLHYAHMTWAQLRALAEGGVTELQNHSYDLHHAHSGVYGCERLPGEGDSAWELRIGSDLQRLQELLHREVGVTPRVFTYPYGRYSAWTEGFCREQGFQATLTCDFGLNRLTHDPDCLWAMKRICRSHGCDLPALLAQAAQTP